MPVEERLRSRSGRAERGLRLLLILVVLIVAVGAMLGRLRPQRAPTPQAPPPEDGPYALRLSGTPLLGEAVAPALAEAWLVSGGAEEVDVAQLRSGAVRRPERVVSARLGERRTRIDILANDDARGLADLAAGRADIALIAQVVAAKTPSGRGVEIAETRVSAAGPPIQRLLLYTAAAPSPAARAFTAFATSDAGQALLRSAGLRPIADAEPTPARRGAPP